MSASQSEMTHPVYGRLIAREGDWCFWRLDRVGAYTLQNLADKPKVIEGAGVIKQAIEMLKKEPERLSGVLFQTNTETWPNQSAKLMVRSNPFNPFVDLNGFSTYVRATLNPLPKASFVAPVPYGMGSFQGRSLKYLSPGRGEGVHDEPPAVTLFDTVEPDDIQQGGVGDCWLVSAIAAVAEFPGAIESLFVDADVTAGRYTVKLFDLPTKSFKDVVIDDRLAVNGNGSGLLAQHITHDGEIWAALVEKAFCQHAGGWDKIQGGWSCFAFAIFTGCLQSYLVSRSQFGTWHRSVCNWNSCKGNYLDHGDFRHVAWDDDRAQVKNDELFALLAQWDSKHFLLCAGTNSNSGDDRNTHQGIHDGHAYTIISVRPKVCGKYDFIMLRNPHGCGEWTGRWADGSAEWKAHPEVKAELDYEEINDDGAFWMLKEDLFRYYATFYVCHKDMGAGAKNNVKKGVTTKTDPGKAGQRKARKNPPALGADFLIGTWKVVSSSDDADDADAKSSSAAAAAKGGPSERVAVVKVSPDGDALLVVHPTKGLSKQRAATLLGASKVFFNGQIGKAEVREAAILGSSTMKLRTSSVRWPDGTVWKKMQEISDKSAETVKRTDPVGGETIEFIVDGEPALVMHPGGVSVATAPSTAAADAEGVGWSSARTVDELATLQVPAALGAALGALGDDLTRAISTDPKDVAARTKVALLAESLQKVKSDLKEATKPKRPPSVAERAKIVEEAARLDAADGPTLQVLVGGKRVLVAKPGGVAIPAAVADSKLAAAALAKGAGALPKEHVPIAVGICANLAVLPCVASKAAAGVKSADEYAEESEQAMTAR